MHLVGGSCFSVSIPIITGLANLPFVDLQSLSVPSAQIWSPRVLVVLSSTL